MSMIDIFIFFLLAMAAIIGWKRGVIKEAISLVGIILVFIIAFTLKEPLGNFLCKYFPFLSFSGSLEGIKVINILLYQLISFLVICGVLLSVYALILKISGIFQKIVNMTIILLLPSKIAGAVISLIKSYVILFVVILVVMIPFKDSSFIKESKFIPKIIGETPILSKSTTSIRKPIEEVYNLTDQVASETISKNDANLEILDVMLEYKVVSKKTVEQLIVLDKLEGINGISSVLSKY